MWPGKLTFVQISLFSDITKLNCCFSDIYVYAEQGDRYDQLALQYYGDPSLWWIISIANSSLSQNSYYPPLGVQIRIPQNIGAIQISFENLNNG